MIALVDANNFYVSAERVFQPELRGKAVVVLSNNDDCVISRSNEAKAMGVPMGVSVREIAPLVRRGEVILRSSNYALYGDMSRRVMEVLARSSPRMEVYSIDEAFVDWSGIADLDAYARSVCAEVQRCTGIPVSAGLGPTKVLAKAANRLVKRRDPTGRCFIMPAERDADLADLEAVAVWGIGRRLSKRLETMGILTALDLARADPARIQREFSVVVASTVMELRGEPCFTLDHAHGPRRSVMVSRTFGRPVRDAATLCNAVAAFTERAAEKLREQSLWAAALGVYAYEPETERTDQRSATLPAPSDDTTVLVGAATDAARRLFRRGTRYRKAGVHLALLTPAGAAQEELFGEPPPPPRAGLMTAMDELNRRFGRGSIRTAASGLDRKAWEGRCAHRSPHFTTDWNDILVVE